MPLPCLLHLAAEPVHTRTAQESLQGSEELLCGAGWPGGCPGQGLQVPCALSCPAATPPSQLSPCSRGRCCCRDINIIFWGLTAECTGAAKLQEWLCWSRLKVELSQQPTCRAGHQQIPWATISTCTQAGFYKPSKRNRIYFEFHTRETILCPFTPEALVCTKNVRSPSDTNTPNVALVCSGNCYSSFHLGRNKLRNKTERNVKELRATSRICVVWPDVPAHCPGSVNLWIIFWQF